MTHSAYKTSSDRKYNTSQEISRLSNIIAASLNHNSCGKIYSNIVETISEFAVGFIAICCNNQCKNEINIKYHYDFMASLDYDLNKIYYYKTTKY
eukprot:369291_1